MFNDYSFSVQERFLRYVQIDTQSDPNATAFPSTEKQKDLARILVTELKELGLQDADMDEYGYVMATIPASGSKKYPVICYCSHMDTAPDCSGNGVKPLVHENYDGSAIVLPDDELQVITVDEHPYLKERIGDTIITASGTTLLGADNKAGVAIIMDIARYFMQHPELEHGAIRILFTPDEEVGRGVDKLDLQKLGADFGYTFDGGERGAFEYENFSADGVTIELFGVSAHPGAAKDKLVNAIKMAADFLERLPKGELSPESTEGRYGFVHPVQMEGIAEKVSLRFIIRDFITAKLAAYEQFLKDKLEETLEAFPGGRASFTVKEQYRNMKDVLDKHPHVIAYAEKAIRDSGLELRVEPIRGGTDGARLSFMGLPCPNIFTGEMALHGKHEYVSVQDMQKSVEVGVRLALSIEPLV